MPISAPRPRRGALARGRLAGLAAACALSLWAGCGGGGGPTTYTLDLSADAIAFEALAGARPPPYQTVSVRFQGDGVIAGYPPGVARPDWLSVTSVPPQVNGVVLVLSPTTTALAPGEYSTTLRVVTGKADGSAYVFKDVSVRYRIWRGLTSSPKSFAFTAVEGAAPGPLDLILASDRASEPWSLAVRPVGGTPGSWLALSAAQGALPDSGGRVEVAPRTMPAGDYQAVIDVLDGEGWARAAIPVAYHVDQVGAVSAPVAFKVDGATGPTGTSRAVTILSRVPGPAGAGLRFTVVPSVPWLTATSARGDLASDVALTVQLDLARIPALADGHHQATVDLVFQGGAASSVQVPVTLDLALPSVQSVVPPVAWAGRDSHAVLRGHGFGAAGGIAVSAGDRSASGQILGDAEVRVRVPALAAGTAAVSAANGLGMFRGGATLRVLPVPQYTALRTEISPYFDTLTLDPERLAVYLSGWNTGGFRRFRFDGAAWTDETIALGDASAAAISADGTELLLVASSDTGPVVVQRRDPATLVLRASESRATRYERYEFLAPFSDGRTLLVDAAGTQSRWYPGSITVSGPGVQLPSPALTRDRHLLLVRGANGTGFSSFESGATAFRAAAVPDFPIGPWAASGDGARIVAGGSVYGRNLALLGAIDVAAPWVYGVAVAPDGDTALLVHQNADYSAVLWHRIDLSGAAGPYPATAVAPPSGLGPGELVTSMAFSDDGAALFLITRAQGTYPDPGRAWFYAVPRP